MKLLVVSEGEHELNPDGETGALVELLRRMIPEEFDYERRKVSDRAVQQVAIRGKSGRHEKRLVDWIRYAQRNGFDALALVVDEDGDVTRRKAVKNAQLHQGFSIQRAIGLAIHMFDAWMLADEQALSAVLGGTVQRQKTPEEIKQPKKEFRRLLNASQNSLSQRDAYLHVARQLDLDKVAKRCPKGFAPFRQHVAQLCSEPG